MLCTVAFCKHLFCVHSVFFSHSSNMACFSAANSLEFQAKQQIKPYQEEEFVLEFVGDETHRSRKRKFVLACSDFRCESCDSSPLRCYSCSSLTNVATKKYRDTRIRILFVIECFANKQTKKGQTVDEKYDWAEREVLKACLLYTSPSPRDGLLSRMPSSA